MAAGVDFDQGGDPWIITFNGSTATKTLPALLCNYDLILRRAVWRSPGAAADDAVIIEDGQGRTVFHEIASGADFDPTQQTMKHERWMATGSGIRVKTFGSGILYLYLQG